MTDNTEWSPKTREDWTSLFSDAFKGAVDKRRSEDEEEAAKKAASEAASGTDKTGKGGSGDAAGKASFADKLLGRSS